MALRTPGLLQLPAAVKEIKLLDVNHLTLRVNRPTQEQQQLCIFLTAYMSSNSKFLNKIL